MTVACLSTLDVVLDVVWVVASAAIVAAGVAFWRRLDN